MYYRKKEKERERKKLIKNSDNIDYDIVVMDIKNEKTNTLSKKRWRKETRVPTVIYVLLIEVPSSTNPEQKSRLNG